MIQERIADTKEYHFKEKEYLKEHLILRGNR